MIPPSALAVLAACLVPLLQTERFASLLNLQGGTSFLRLRLWEASWAMVKDHPWTGVGLDNFLYYYGDYILPGAEIERWLSHPHNIVLDLLVRTGLPGLLGAHQGEQRYSDQVGTRENQARELLSTPDIAITYFVSPAPFTAAAKMMFIASKRL